VSLLFIGQVLPILDYEFGVKMGSQEAVKYIGQTGLAFNKGFIFADTIFYVPLFIVGLFLHMNGHEAHKALLGGAYALTVYWPLVFRSVLENAEYSLPEEATQQWNTVLPLISLWGLVCLILVAMDTDRDTGQRQKQVRLSPNLCLFCGVLSPYFYLCNDICMTFIHSNEFDWKSTSMSDLAAIGDDQQIVSRYLLLAFALTLVVFGLGLAMHVDVLLGVFQMVIGLCKALSSKIYLLENPVQRNLFSGFSKQSLVHVLLVVVSIIFTILSLDRAMNHIRSSSMFAWVTSRLVPLFVLVGISGAALRPNLVGIFERISVYSIQFWTIFLACVSLQRQAKVAKVEK